MALRHGASPAAGCLAVLMATAAVTGVDEGTCAAGSKCGQQQHFWPNVRGHVGSYGVSNLTGPKDITKPSWKFQNENGQYASVIVGGPVIDSEKNLYIVEMHRLTKLSPDGQIIWQTHPPIGALFPDGPSLMGDSVYVTLSPGALCRIRLDNGQVVWTKIYYETSGSDSKYVTAHDGIVVIGMDSANQFGGGSRHILGIDGDSGDLVWDFKPDSPTWNNLGMFAEDDTLVLQDWDARVYRLGTHNGSLLWKGGGTGGRTWSDGGTTLGANGIVYSANADTFQDGASTPYMGGGLHAYRFSDGKHLWSQKTAHGVYTWPVAGQLGGDGGWSAVIASGAIPVCESWRRAARSSIYEACPRFAMVGVILSLFMTIARPWKRPLKLILKIFVLCLGAAGLAVGLALYRYVNQFPAYDFDIAAYDAETGSPRWKLQLPTWTRVGSRGDDEGAFLREKHSPWRGMCCPASFGTPAVDGNGVVYIGHASGLLYAIKDLNNNGFLDPEDVKTFDTGGAFLHSGAAFAPGLFAYTTCDTLYVYKT